MLTRVQRLALIAFIVLIAVLAAQGEPVEARVPPHLGYGVSIAPHIDVPPDLLTKLGADWVLVYDTDQIPLFPKQKVLYRTDVRGYPTNVQAWEQGMTDLAKQLKAQGARAIAIGNEPNLRAEWGGQTPDPKLYADILCRGYRAFKQAAPNITVVSGGLAPTSNSSLAMDDMLFAQRMIDAGGGRCFDAFGYHPYGFNQTPEADPYRNPFSYRRAERMYRLLAENGLSDRQMWITEFGWVRSPSAEGLGCDGTLGFRDFQWMQVSADVQADYTVRAYAFADANWPWVGPMFLWNLNWNQYDTSYEDGCSNLRYYSMVQRNGTPLPVFTAFQQMPKRIRGFDTPELGASAHDMTQVAEAGCAGLLELGSFTVLNTGYPGALNVNISAANGPGVPFVAVSTAAASSGTVVTVVVDANNIKPGLYLLPINLRSSIGDRTASYVVKAWLLLREPSTPECVARYNAQQSK